MPSSSQPQAPRCAGEPGAGQRVLHRGALADRDRFQHRHPVDFLDQQRTDAPSAYQIGQRRRGRGMCLGVVGEAQQRAAAAFEKPSELTVDNRHQRARLAARPVRHLFVSLRLRGPRQGGAIRVGGIGRCQHDRVVLPAVRFDTVEVGPQPVDGRGDRELGPAQ